MHHPACDDHQRTPRVRRRRPAARILPLCTASVLLLVLGSCANPPGTPRARAGRCNVGIVGDSLLVGAQSSGGLGRKLYDNVCSVTVSDGKVGRSTSAGASIVEEWAEADRLPAVLVVELGTNDCSARTFERAARQIIESAGRSRPIVWVNTWRPGCDGQINEVIDTLRKESRKEAGRGRIWVVDHHSWIEQNPRFLAADGIHLTVDGYQAFAQRIVDSLGIRQRT